MKAKEFLNKIMRGDKTTIRKNTGVIGFDEKGNRIEVMGITGFYAKQMEGPVFYMISPDNFSGSFSLIYDSNELAIDDDYYIGEVSQIPSEGIEEIKEFFDIDIDIIGWYLAYVMITNKELITVGNHTVTATYNGQSVTFTMTFEEDNNNDNNNQGE